MKRTLLISALLAFALSTSTLAQDRYAHKNATFWAQVDIQTAESLESPIPQVRSQTMKNIVYFATFYRDKVSFGDDVNQLIHLHRRDSDETNRTLALVALHSIGSIEAMQYLNTVLTPESTDEVREMMVTVLSKFYTTSTVAA